MTVIPDQPITKIEDDRLGRGEFAKRIAGVISSLNDQSSIVVSINAPWGEGKTSVLKMIEGELNSSENSIVIWFNPWRFPDEDHLLLNFFQTLDSHLKFNLKGVSEKIGEGFKDIVSFLSGIQVMGFGLGEGAKEVAEKRLPGTDIEEATRKVKDALQDSPKKIVIFMDDIDRLDKRDIQAVFRLVKLTADFPNTAYVLAFDDEMVSASLAEQFGNIEAGRSFLEKIVQVPLPVPPADRQLLRKMLFERINTVLKSIEVELTEAEGLQFTRVFDKSFSRMLSSPRAVKRYSNMLNFALPILKDEANMCDLILIEGVRAFYPKVYETVRAEFGSFLKDSYDYLWTTDRTSVRKRFGKILAKSVEGFTEEEIYGVHFALQILFPNIQEYGINVAMSYASSNSANWEPNKRICASKYFRRYFNYGIPPNDISDKDVKRFIDNLSESAIEQLTGELETLCGEGRAEILIHKLTRYEDKINPTYVDKLAIAIARKSNLIPESHPEDNFFGIGALAQAAFLLRELINRIEDAATRENVAKDVAKSIDKLPFACEFRDKVRKMRKERGSEEFISVVSDECEQEIGRIFAEKLSRAAETQPLEDSYPLFKRRFYFEWKTSDLESLRQYAQHRLESHPENVSEFLSALAGIGNDKDTDILTTQESDGVYQFLADILDPDEWIKFIRHVYPETSINQLPRVVRWFVQMHKAHTLRKEVERLEAMGRRETEQENESREETHADE